MGELLCYQKHPFVMKHSILAFYIGLKADQSALAGKYAANHAALPFLFATTLALLTSISNIGRNVANVSKVAVFCC